MQFTVSTKMFGCYVVLFTSLMLSCASSTLTDLDSGDHSGLLDLSGDPDMGRRDANRDATSDSADADRDVASDGADSSDVVDSNVADLPDDTGTDAMDDMLDSGDDALDAGDVIDLLDLDLEDCGDGVVQDVEQCDDGMPLEDGDGCSAICRIESGWSCDDASPSSCVPLTAPPVVEGELTAGHRRPAWGWTVPDGAASFRWRIDTGDWESVSSTTTLTRPSADLTDGSHLFEVQASNSQGAWSASGTFTTVVEFFERDGFWNGVNHDISTSPLGNACAVSCHNCYEKDANNSALNLSITLDLLANAITDGADLLELDVIDTGAVTYVDHDDDGGTTGALWVEVLEDVNLAEASQPLFIEIKENSPSVAFSRRLLDEVNAQRQAYVRNGRPIVFRAFHVRRQNLAYIRDALATGDYPFIENYVRLQVLFTGDQVAEVADFQTLIEQVGLDGYDGVEFEYRDRNMWGKLTYARSLGLGVAVYTVPTGGGFGEVYISAMREDLDVITTDYALDEARVLIEDDTSLLYMNAWDQTFDADEIGYHRTTRGVPFAATINGDGTPTGADWVTGEDLFGTILSFASATNESITFYDGDPSDGSDGVLVAVVVNFDDLATVAENDTHVLVGKADASGWSLELYNPSDGDTVLRFGAHVNDAYRYATVPAADFNGADSYLVVGAYDGDGSIRIFVNNSADGTSASSSQTGGIATNASPIVLGADPQGAVDRQFFFDGKIQMVLVQAWHNH